MKNEDKLCINTLRCLSIDMVQKAKSGHPGMPEASSVFGWSKYAHYTIGMNTFGASAPGSENMEKFGFTVENIKQKVIELFCEISSECEKREIRESGTIGFLECQRR